MSVFLRQPMTPEEIEMAWRAVEVCPTRSVGHETLRRPDRPVFPQDLGDGVFRLGHNAESSFGAHSYLVQRVIDGVPSNLLIAAAFLVVAVVGVTASAWVLAVGYAAHGAKDFWQERTRFAAD